MKSIAEFARKPQLIEIVLDDETIMENYGETITFYIKDYVDIATYFDFFKSQGDGKGDQLNELLRKIILNADGVPVMKEDESIPVDIMISALTRINETLGKSRTKSLAKETGTLPS